jgi:hypothetical protein
MRRFVIATLFLAMCATATTVPGISIRGKLTKSPDKQPALDPGDHKLISLAGDDATIGVLNDERLGGVDFEAIGHFESPGHFMIDPITSKALFVHKNGKRLMVTYWCDVCYIRTYTPGKCVCCQKWTDLDLRESDEP